MKKVFSENLKDFMIEKGFNKVSFSKASKINYSMLDLYVSGIYLPTLNNLKKMMTTLNCSADFLFGLTENPEPKLFKDKSSFYDKYKKLLNKHGITNYRLCKELNLGLSAHIRWRKGAYPRLETIVKIAEYFGESIDYLIS